jgi:hypothetical protein
MERSSVMNIDYIYKYSSYRGYNIIAVAIKILSLIRYTRSYLNFFFWAVHSWEEAEVTAIFADYVGTQNNLGNMPCKFVVDKLYPMSL